MRSSGVQKTSSTVGACSQETSVLAHRLAGIESFSQSKTWDPEVGQIAGGREELLRIPFLSANDAFAGDIRR